jgi:hypothetical protein
VAARISDLPQQQDSLANFVNGIVCLCMVVSCTAKDEELSVVRDAIANCSNNLPTMQRAGGGSIPVAVLCFDE